MGDWTKLKARDGHELAAYVAKPEGAPKGGLVVIQEIFGVNRHIRAVVDGFAQNGYVAIAPAMFDRVESGVELTYEGDDIQKGVALRMKLDDEQALSDIAAAFQHVQNEGKGGAIVGYCFGGLMAWLSATRGEQLGFTPKCTVGYYGGGIGKVASEDPACPVMLHFGADDDHIGKDQIDAVRNAHPEVQIFMYEGAGHGFNCNARASFNPQATALARERTLAFFEQSLG